MKESTLWMWHIFAGAVIFFLLGLHMLLLHYDSILFVLGIGKENVLSAEAVFARSKEISFLVIYILLLGFALYHGLYGLKDILFELTLPKALEAIVSVVLVLTGLGLFIYGTYAAIVVFGMTIV